MSGAVTTYGLLIVAILAETFATSSLNASQQFTRLVPTLCSIIGYVVSFYTFSHVVKVMPVGIGYAIWCALGIVLISVVGVVYFKQPRLYRPWPDHCGRGRHQCILRFSKALNPICAAKLQPEAN